MSGLYLHIPFCKQACSYCDFYFVTRQQQQEKFIDSLVEEIKMKGSQSFSEEVVNTIYFGGGTPSLLSPKQLEKILSAIYDSFKLDISECTLEMNPDDVSKEFLESIKSLGINRASMGIQSFNEDLLQFMHRAHTSSEAHNCLELLSVTGFDSFTVDLIYGNPNQSLDMLNEDLKVLKKFNPPHVSAYSLTIEDGTRLGKQVELGRLSPLTDDLVAKHIKLVRDELTEIGLFQYEVSNFSKPGFEAKHNSAYWTHENYLGFGPSAHSFWWSKDEILASRWNNKRDIKAYLESDWELKNEEESLSLQQLAEERLMLGLRTSTGIEISELQSRYGFSFSEKQLDNIESKEEEGLLIYKSDTISLTPHGLLIADLILLDLLTA